MIRAIAARMATRWIDASDADVYAKRFSRTQKFRRNVPISLSFEDGLFLVQQDNETLAVARKSRLHFYTRGLDKRLDTIRREYCLTDNILRPDDIVIDCGANIGEFSLICACAGAKVIAFEPDRVEFKALQRNCSERSVTPFQKALWKENGKMRFFDKNDTGDSSLIDQGNSNGSYEVVTQKLDNAPEVPDTDIRLIKLEAEGAEPEILQGMTATLKRTQFITIDMGPERGLEKANTVVECTEVLYKAGFRMRSFFPARCTALFERTRINT